MTKQHHLRKNLTCFFQRLRREGFTCPYSTETLTWSWRGCIAMGMTCGKSQAFVWIWHQEDFTAASIGYAQPWIGWKKPNYVRALLKHFFELVSSVTLWWNCPAFCLWRYPTGHNHGALVLLSSYKWWGKKTCWFHAIKLTWQWHCGNFILPLGLLYQF